MQRKGTDEKDQCVMVSLSNHRIGKPSRHPFDKLRVT